MSEGISGSLSWCRQCDLTGARGSLIGFPQALVLRQVVSGTQKNSSIFVLWVLLLLLLRHVYLCMRALCVLGCAATRSILLSLHAGWSRSVPGMHVHGALRLSVRLLSLVAAVQFSPFSPEENPRHQTQSHDPYCGGEDIALRRMIAGVFWVASGFWLSSPFLVPSLVPVPFRLAVFQCVSGSLRSFSFQKVPSRAVCGGWWLAQCGCA
mmetsp:Transcript_5593/g.13945  ORF Transcript_5593/g.13945 Transcript_5593/m.13945 type:complete len:209 (-) Transcript_5593:45-671(-)